LMLVTAGASSYRPEGPVDGTALVWDLAALRPKVTIKGNGSVILGACFSPDSRLLATAPSGAKASLWDLSRVPPAASDGVEAVAPTLGR
jgi:WD40 repeat protein